MYFQRDLENILLVFQRPSVVPQFLQGSNVDPTRIVGQIVTGIGFIGAGVILTRQGVVVGITSASVIWVLTGIGIFIGFDRYVAAILLSIVTVGILRGVDLLETLFKSLSHEIVEKFDLHKKKSSMTLTLNSIQTAFQ